MTKRAILGNIQNFLFAAIMLAFVAAVAEIFSYAFWRLEGDQYFAPQPSRYEYLAKLEEQYRAENFDAGLGWIPLKRDREANGARIAPNNPKSGRHCLSVYGDSFSFGNEVDHFSAWPNQLAAMLRCKVENFGVSGYGTDQAYLRFKGNVSDQSRIVALGIVPENIVRNVNQNRAFLYGTTAVGPLKPIFWLDDAHHMRLVSVPRLAADSYNQYLNDPRALFSKEYFIPDSSSYAEQRAHFPFVLSLVHLLRYKRVYYGLRYYFDGGLPWYQKFYEFSHPSHALQITESIVESFVDDAKERAKIPIVLFIPTSRDFLPYLETKKWVYGTLYKWCESKGYSCFDAGSALVDKLGAKNTKEDLCEYFCTIPLTKQGHYNAKGNALLAEVISSYLQRYILADKTIKDAVP